MMVLVPEANGKSSSCYRYLADFEERFPEVGYFYDLKFENYDGNGSLK